MKPDYADALRILRLSMRHLRFMGTYNGFRTKEEGEFFERAIARAEYELGLLDEGVNQRNYGFSEFSED